MAASETIDQQRADVLETVTTLLDRSLTSSDALQQYFNQIPSFYELMPTSPDKYTITDEKVANLENQAAESPVLDYRYLPSFLISQPGAPTLQAIDTPSVANIPEFTAVAPELEFPDKPDPTLPGAPTNAPDFNAPATPDKPVFTLPSPPSIQSIAIPEVPSVTLPVFNMEMDFGEVAAPTERFQFNETEYQSAMLDQLQSKLLYDLINGGYGIDDDDDRRLWDRAREREMITADASMEELRRQTAALGFDMPPGTFYKRLDTINQQAQENINGLSRDIAIKRADQYVQNRQFTIQTAQQVEALLINYYGAVAERALNASRTQVEMGAVLFNAHVAKQNLKLDQYRTYAQVFSEQVRAAIAGLEAFKVQVEAASLTAEVQKVYADIYQTQLEGVKALVDVYNTELQAAQVSAQIETLKLEAFRSKVETYAEQVRAKSAEFDLYEAGIRGETAKLDKFKVEADAYTARVSGFEAKTRSETLRVRSQVDANNSLLVGYRSDIDKYRAQIAKVNAETSAILETYNSQVRQYASKVDAYKASADSASSVDAANAQLAVAHYQGLLERYRTQSDTALKLFELGLTSQQAGADIHKDLAVSYSSGILSATSAIESI